MRIERWQDWTILAAAAWLYASPFVFGTALLANPLTMVTWVCATALIASASEAVTFPDPIEEWVHAIAGVALVAAPFVVADAATMATFVNSVVVGLVVTACGVSALRRPRASSPQARLADLDMGPVDGGRR